MSSSNPLSPKAERALVLGRGHLEAVAYMEASRRDDDAHRQARLAAEQFAIAGDSDGEREAWTHAARLSHKLGTLERALEEIGHAVELARTAGLDEALALLLGNRGFLEAQRGANVEAAVAWHEALDLAEKLGQPQMIASYAGNLGQLELGRGALDAAESVYLRALAAAESQGDDLERAEAENALGEIARTRGDLAQAMLRFETALAAGQRVANPGLLARTYANLGNIARIGGNLARAERLFEASMRIATAGGDEAAVARAHTNLGNVDAARGKVGAARRHYQKALAYDKKRGHTGTASVIGGLVNMGNLLVVEGRLGEARASFIEALDKLRPLHSLRTSADVLLLLGQVEARQGHLATASERFDAALDAARTAGHRPGEARLALCRAALDHARGHVKKALVGFREAVLALEAEGVASDIATAHLVVAECALVAGDRELAEAAVAAADAMLAGLAAESGESAEAPGPREGLDLRAMRARLELSRDAAAARDEALATADAMEEAERVVDALALRLVVADEGDEAQVDADRALAEAVSEAARALALEPLQLDAQSLAWSLAPDEAAIAGLEEAGARAFTLGLGLLVARIRRRLVRALFALGQSDKAEAQRQIALAWANGEGALEESQRLLRMGAT